MKVPVYEAPRSEDAPLATPYSNVRPADGSALAQSFTEAGQAIGRGVDELHKAYLDAAHTEATDKLTQLQSAATDQLHGNEQQAARQQAIDNQVQWDAPEPGVLPDQQPQPGDASGGTGQAFLATRGTEAAAKSVPTLQDFDEKRKALRESLSSDAARKFFDTHAAGITDGFRRQLEDHVTQQVLVAREASSQARQATSLTAIANDYTSDSTAVEQSKSVEASIRALQLSPEDGDAKVAAWRQQVAEVRLNQFLAERNWQGASALLSETKDVLGPKADRFTRAVSDLRKDDMGETMAQQIYNASVNPESGWVDSAKAFAALDKMPNGPAKDETRQRLEHRVNIGEHQKTQAITDVFNSALSAYQKGGNSLSAVSATDRAFLQDPKNDPKEWEKLQSIARADREHARGAPPSMDQVAAMTSFRVWVADNPEEASTMTVDEFNRTWLPTFAKRDREQAATVFASAHAKENGTQKLPPIVDQVLISTGRDAGVFPVKDSPAKWDDDASTVYAHAVDELTQQSAQYRRANGKPPPVELVKEWTNKMFVQGKVPGSGIFGTGFFKDSTTAIEAQIGHKQFEPVWTDKQKEDAKNALQGANATVNDDSIDRYLRRKAGLSVLPVQRTEPTTPPIPTSNDDAPAEGD